MKLQLLKDLQKLKHLLVFSFILLLYACGNNASVPKPIGYYRIDFPEHEYQHKAPDCPFEFDISKYSRLTFYTDSLNADPCWFNIDYPTLRATVYVTYKPVDDNIREYIEEAHWLAYQHQIKASRIATQAIKNDSTKVYGLIYDLGGSVASPYQFYLTDSTEHFLRASFYFNVRPNPDSSKPALDYVKKDIDRFIESFKWKY